MKRGKKNQGYCFIGWNLRIVNSQLDVSLDASPNEIMIALQGDTVRFGQIAEHIETEIQASELTASCDISCFGKGQESDEIVHLLECLNKQDAKAANQLLLENPLLLTRDQDGHVPLAMCSFMGLVDGVRLLLEWHCDVNIQDEMGMAALHWAAGKGQSEAVTALLESGADPALKSWWMLSPLDLAIHNKHKAVVRLIRESRAEVPSGREISDVLRDMGAPVPW